jgi:uncharacterized protein (DUF1800 family)
MKIKFLALVYTLALVSCGGGGGGGAGTPNGSGVSGLLGFHLAAVEGATCILTRSDGTTSSHATNSSGFVDFSGLTIPAGLTQLSCSGGNYKDEATGDIVDPTPTMRAATNYSGSGELRLIASAISEIAFRMAGSNLLADTVDDYNTQVADMLGLDDIDIVATVPVDMNNVANGNVTAANTPEQRIGMINAALSQIGENQNETMEQVIERMIIEMADGDMSDDVDNDISDAIDDLQNNVDGNGIGDVMDTGAETAISGAEDGTVTVSIAPIANAGADQIVNQGTIVTLDASHSTATTGSIVSYKWSAPTGISLSDNTTQSPTFTALTAGTYSFTLTVANDNNITSATDEVVVIVTIGDTTPPITTASLASGYYNTQQTITLTVNEEAIIYYTTNGTTPTTTSGTYTSPIAISTEGETTLQYFAVDTAGNAENVQSKTYTIDTIAPIASVSIDGGFYTSTQTISLSSNEDSVIYYTLDNTTPNENSNIYQNPLILNDSTTLQFFAIDNAQNKSTIVTKQYLFGTTPTQADLASSSDSGISNTDNITNLSDLEFSGFAIPNSEVSFIGNLAGSTTANANGSWNIIVNGVVAEDYVIIIKSVLGNQTFYNHNPLFVQVDKSSPTTTIDTIGGLFNTQQTITLTVDEGATIYYTTDGTTPTSSSSVYSSAIITPLNQTTNLQYFAVDTAGNIEAVQSQTYTIDNIAPTTTADIASGYYNTQQTITLAVNEGATIYYTTDGTTPTTTSGTYTSPITISTEGETILQYFAKDTAGNIEGVQSKTYTIDTTAPTIELLAGTIPESSNATVKTNEQGKIYLVNSTITVSTEADITSSGDEYHNVINSYTVNAFNNLPALGLVGGEYVAYAVDLAGNLSLVSSNDITVAPIPNSSANPAGGNYAGSGTITVSLTVDQSALIYYTTDGTTPTQTVENRYNGIISMSSNTYLKYFAVDIYGQIEELNTDYYSFDGTPPITTADIPSGSYNTNQTITLTVNEEATIYYTTDGTTPTLTSSVYATPIVIDSEGTTILQYFAQDIGGNSESVQSRTYTIDTIAPTTLVNIASGYYNTTQTITLSTTETATIYYTTDGTTPTSASTIYINPVVATMNATTHLQFFAIDAAGNSESVQSKTYTIDNIPPQLSTHKNITIIKNSTVHDDTGTSGVVAPNLNSLTTDNLTTNENLEFKIVNYASIPTDFGVSLGMDAANSENYAKTRPNGNDIHIHPTTDFVGTTTITLLARDEVGNESSPISFVLSIVEGNTDSDGDGVSDATELSMGLNPLSSDDIVTVSSNVPSGCCLFSSCFTMVTTTKTVGVAANLVGGSDNGNLSTINLDKGFLEFNELTGEYSFTPHHNACTEHPYGELCLTSFEYEIGGITHKITLNIDRELEFASSNTTAIIGENKTLVVDPDGEPVNVNITTAPTIGNTTISKSQATYSSTVNNYILTNINDFVDSEIDIVKFNVTDINNNTSSKTINITLDLGDDSDNGGIPDVIEDYFSLDKTNASDDTADKDGDKINNRSEVFLTYNPLVDETLPQTSDADKLNFKVMNRLAFGVNDSLTTDISNSGGVDSWVDDQLSSPQTDLDDGTDGGAQAKLDNFNWQDFSNVDRYLQVYGSVRPIHSDKQLQSIMARFWDNHFNTQFQTHQRTWIEMWEADEFYKRSLGNFKDLVMFSAKSPVMSIYLNGNTNIKGKPNENFAREIMELHTLGVDGGYTDEDIKQLARIFTGWTYSTNGSPKRYTLKTPDDNLYTHNNYTFTFTVNNHDDGTADLDSDGNLDGDKPFLTTVPDTPNYDDGVGTRTIASRSGADGVIEGEKAIDILAKHPTTAKYICTKLTKFLVSDNPTTATIAACKTEFLAQKDASDQIAKVIKVIFDTTEFKDINKEKRKLKDTQEYILSIGRLLEIDATKHQNYSGLLFNNIGSRLKDAGQTFFQKPEPTGYPEISSQWNKTDIAFNRIAQLNQILQNPTYDYVDLEQFFKGKNLMTAKEIIEFLLPKITAGYYDGAFVQQAYDILRPNNEVFNINNSKGKLQKLLGFLLASPEFNLH